MKILFTYDYGKEAVESIRELGYDVDVIQETKTNEYEYKEDVEILICYNPFKYINLRDFKNLKVILLSSIGFDQIPKDIVKEMNITVCNNRGGYSIPMGEWIVMKALELTKNSKLHFENQNNHKWSMDTNALELYEKRILFFGTGTIAYEAAKRLVGFNMHITGLNTDGRDVKGFHLCKPLSLAKEEVEKADVIVIALPSTKITKGIFNKDLIDSMKSDAVIINIARGDIIDEVSLMDALRNKRIKAAALDVFLEEPLPKEHPMWELDNVLISCHNSWISEKRNERRFNAIYKNLKLYINNNNLLNVINIERGY